MLQVLLLVGPSKVKSNSYKAQYVCRQSVKKCLLHIVTDFNSVNKIVLELEIRSVEHGICLIADIMEF